MLLNRFLFSKMVNNVKHNFLFLIFALLYLLNGCGGIGQKSPSEVVRAFYMAANEGKYSESEKYLSSEALNALKSGMGMFVGGMKGLLDKATRNGRIEKVEILKEEIRGEGAEVRFRVFFKDGDSKKDSETLIREDGVWKISIR